VQKEKGNLFSGRELEDEEGSSTPRKDTTEGAIKEGSPRISIEAVKEKSLS